MNPASVIAQTGIVRRVLPWVGLAAGGLVALDVGRYLFGAGSGDRGTVTGTVLENQSLAGFALRNAMHPLRLWTMQETAGDAEQAAQMLYDPRRSQRHTDDAADAFRHAYAGALLTYRLAHDRGMGLGDAQAWVLEGGRAHEDDSPLEGRHYENARLMDESNNLAGASLITSVDVDGGIADVESVLAQRVLDAMQGGRLLVLDGPEWAPTATGSVNLPRSAVTTD